MTPETVAAVVAGVTLGRILTWLHPWRRLVDWRRNRSDLRLPIHHRAPTVHPAHPNRRNAMTRRRISTTLSVLSIACTAGVLLVLLLW